MATAPPAYTTRSLLALLQRHFIKPGESLPGGVFLTEVPAPHASRRADALYIGFTGSRGHHIQVFEIKVSRADWLTELGDPTKAEAWWKHCHKFTVVCPRGVVKLGELPDGWGLMHPGKSKIRMDIEVKPTLHEPEITMGLLLEVAKKLDLHRERAASAARNDFEQRVREEVSKRTDRECKDRDRYADDRELRSTTTLQKLSDLTGLRLDGAQGGKYAALDEVADAIKAYCLGHVERQRVLKRASAQLENLQRDVSEALSGLAPEE